MSTTSGSGRGRRISTTPRPADGAPHHRARRRRAAGADGRQCRLAHDDVRCRRGGGGLSSGRTARPRSPVRSTRRSPISRRAVDDPRMWPAGCRVRKTSSAISARRPKGGAETSTRSTRTRSSGWGFLCRSSPRGLRNAASPCSRCRGARSPEPTVDSLSARIGRVESLFAEGGRYERRRRPGRAPRAAGPSCAAAGRAAPDMSGCTFAVSVLRRNSSPVTVPVAPRKRRVSA